MSKKILALITVVISMSLLASVASAQEPETMSVWTDKSQYTAGETGTLYIVFYNNKGRTVTIEKITITFESWRAYKSGQWEGNYTLDFTGAFMEDEMFEKEISFTVPTDGRAVSTKAKVEIDTENIGILEKKCDISVSETPVHMEQIITLFTILVVLLIVCTIIVAATIFLSARKPQAVLRREERAE